MLFPLPYFWDVMNEDNEIIFIIHSYAVVVWGVVGVLFLWFFGFFVRKPRESAVFWYVIFSFLCLLPVHQVQPLHHRNTVSWRRNCSKIKEILAFPGIWVFHLPKRLEQSRCPCSIKVRQNRQLTPVLQWFQHFPPKRTPRHHLLWRQKGFVCLKSHFALEGSPGIHHPGNWDTCRENLSGAGNTKIVQVSLTLSIF